MRHTIIAIAIIYGFAAVQSQCDSGWVAYADGKCFKLFDDYVTRENAELICTDNQNPVDEPSVGFIKSEAEQQFLVNYLFNTLGVSDGVWIGGKRSSGNTSDFVWDDGSSIQYSNWGVNNPTDDERRTCVRIVSELTRDTKASNGDWFDTTCTTRNLVLCQKLQSLSLDDIRKQLLKLREDVTTQALKLKEVTEESAKLTQQIVPIGFIYTELPNMPSPQALWPSMQWQDVSTTFAGQFFRVLGGGSDAWGAVQGECASRISAIKYVSDGGAHNYIDMPYNGWAAPVQTGDWSSGAQHSNMYTSFHVQHCENRPKNSAVRVWIRSA